MFKPLSTCSLQKTKLKNLKNNPFKSEYILKYYGTITCVYMYVQGILTYILGQSNIIHKSKFCTQLT